jgi:hypothetical protein
MPAKQSETTIRPALDPAQNGKHTSSAAAETSSASLVWTILFSAILGWLLGVVSSALFRWRTQAPRA